MNEIKQDGEVLAEIYRNAQLAIESIADILPEVEGTEMREEILSEHEEYERICAEATALAQAKSLEIRDPSPVKKAMMWSAIKMNTMADNSSQHVASMMIKGTVQGITSLKTTLSDGEKVMDEEVRTLLKNLIALEEGFERKLKKFL